MPIILHLAMDCSAHAPTVCAGRARHVHAQDGRQAVRKVAEGALLLRVPWQHAAANHRLVIHAYTSKCKHEHMHTCSHTRLRAHARSHSRTRFCTHGCVGMACLVGWQTSLCAGFTLPTSLPGSIQRAIHVAGARMLRAARQGLLVGAHGSYKMAPPPSSHMYDLLPSSALHALRPACWVRLLQAPALAALSPDHARSPKGQNGPQRHLHMLRACVRTRHCSSGASCAFVRLPLHSSCPPSLEV